VGAVDDHLAARGEDRQEVAQHEAGGQIPGSSRISTSGS
jgi:hypothetical protein